MKHNRRFLILPATLLACAVIFPVYTQTPEQQSAPPAGAQQVQGGGDPIRRLNLTPDQLEQIRSIREQSKTERGTINERLVQANRALEESLELDTPDEALVEQRVREVNAAQYAAMKMRILTEVKIRRVLTAEQRSLLRTFRVRARDVRRERRIEGLDRQQKRREQRTLRMENQRNGMGPLIRRREVQRQRRP